MAIPVICDAAASPALPAMVISPISATCWSSNRDGHSLEEKAELVEHLLAKIKKFMQDVTK